MYELFGDNLTSDAEEDEMLMVSRKRVKGIYAQCEKVQMDDSPNLPAEAVDAASNKMALLSSLFGSKCLPDEAEEAPAVPRFNVGDWVRCEEAVGIVKEHDDGDKSTLVEFIGDEPMTIWVADKDLTPCDGPKHDSSRNERRLNVAVQLTQAMFANPTSIKFFTYAELVQKAVEATDALIAECEKGGTE